MVIDHNGERIVVKPANIEDLGTPEVEGNKGQLFAEFTREGITCIRRAYTTKKAPEEGERPFFVKVAGAVAPIEEVAPVKWCEADGRPAL